jgi:hypothetical protein
MADIFSHALHEAAHAVVAEHCGADVESIEVGALGGKVHARFTAATNTPANRVRVMLAGVVAEALATGLDPTKRLSLPGMADWLDSRSEGLSEERLLELQLEVLELLTGQLYLAWQDQTHVLALAAMTQQELKQWPTATVPRRTSAAASPTSSPSSGSASRH